MELYEYLVEPEISDSQVQEDVQKIYKACKGFGCDKKSLIEVFGSRTSTQISQLAKAYKANRGENLVDLVKKETSGNLEGLLVDLCHSFLVLDCDKIYRAFKSLGTDEKSIMEVLVCKSNQEIMALKTAFKAIYEKDLERELEKNVGGGSDTKRLFVAIMQAARKDGEVTSEDVASFPENPFPFFTTKSESFLRQLFIKHNEQGGKSVQELIKKKFSGQAEELLLLMCSSILNKPRFYACLLEDTMKGMGTNEKELSYWVARCREPSLMGAIKEAYVDLYQKTLESRIKGEVSGDYERLLIMIVERGIAVKANAGPYNPVAQTLPVLPLKNDYQSQLEADKAQLREEAGKARLEADKARAEAEKVRIEAEIQVRNAAKGRALYEESMTRLSTSTLFNGAALHQDQRITSQNGKFFLIMQRDGNLMIYGPLGPCWASNTHGRGHPPFHAVNQPDGNLVVYDGHNQQLWGSNTVGLGPQTRVFLQDDGRLTIYVDSTIRWMN